MTSCPVWHRMAQWYRIMIGKCWRKRHDVIRGTVPTFAQNYFENQREPKVEMAGDLNLWSPEYEEERLPYRVVRCRKLWYTIQASVNIMCCFQDYWINTWRDTMWGITFLASLVHTKLRSDYVKVTGHRGDLDVDGRIIWNLLED
jgi:hypothetical protein